MIDQTTERLNWDQTREENEDAHRLGGDWGNPTLGIPDTWGGPGPELDQDEVQAEVWRQEATRRREDRERERDEQQQIREAERWNNALEDWAGPTDNSGWN